MASFKVRRQSNLMGGAYIPSSATLEVDGKMIFGANSASFSNMLVGVVQFDVAAFSNAAASGVNVNSAVIANLPVGAKVFCEPTTAPSGLQLLAASVLTASYISGSWWPSGSTTAAASVKVSYLAIY